MVQQDGRLQELAQLLQSTSQRLADTERSWQADKRSLEGQLATGQHGLRDAQAANDQLRYAQLQLSSFQKRKIQSLSCCAAHA